MSNGVEQLSKKAPCWLRWIGQASKLALRASVSLAATGATGSYCARLSWASVRDARQRCLVKKYIDINTNYKAILSTHRTAIAQHRREGGQNTPSPKTYTHRSPAHPRGKRPAARHTASHRGSPHHTARLTATHRGSPQREPQRIRPRAASRARHTRVFTHRPRR